MSDYHTVAVYADQQGELFDTTLKLRKEVGGRVSKTQTIDYLLFLSRKYGTKHMKAWRKDFESRRNANDN